MRSSKRKLSKDKAGQTKKSRVSADPELNGTTQSSGSLGSANAVSGAGGDTGSLEKPVYSRKRAYEEFERRFANVKIFVDEFNSVPSRVWYQHKEQRGLQEDCKYKLISMFKALEGSSINKAFYPTTANRAYLEFANLHIDFLTQGLIMDYGRSPPGWTEIDVERHQDLVTDHPLQVLGLRYKDAAAREFVECVQMGFLHNMHNSLGREALRAIIEFAGKIAFGPSFPDNSLSKIISLGTSNYPVEGFPVDVVESALLTSNHSRLRSSRSPNSSDGAFRRPVSYRASSSHSSSSRKSNVFSDVVVTSVDDNGWSKYLMVCEVKSGYQSFSSTENAQLIREMIGACMHQSEVFGLMMNAGFAKLVRLTHDPVNKKLTCYELLKDQYMFLNPVMDSDAVSFQAQDLKRLTRDLVMVLTYAKDNIHQIDPLQDVSIGN